MAEYSRTVYNFNNRFKLNDDTTDTTKYALVDTQFYFDTVSDNVEEDKPTEPGIIDYGIKLGKSQIVIPIVLYASTDANMSSLIQSIKTAFNPDLCEADTTYGETTDYCGYLPFDWTEDVGGTSRAFRLWVKPMEIPAVIQDPIGGLIRAMKLKLKARDPRKYLQTATTLSGVGTATNAGTYPTPVKITITATGASSTSLQVTNSTTGKSIYVTTALANADVLVIDTFLHSVKLNGVEKRSMLGNTSEWFTLSPGNNTLAVTNGTNVTVAFQWYGAWPL